jgi:hypothetical protein
MLKVCNTTQLREMLKRARPHVHSSKALAPPTLERLDDDGLHVLESIMLHEYYRMAAVRCRAHLKMKDRPKDQPLTVMLDLPADLFNQCADAEALTASLETEVGEEEAAAAAADL